MINLASSWSIINTLRFRSTRVTWDGLRPSMEYKSCIHTYTVYNASQGTSSETFFVLVDLKSTFPTPPIERGPKSSFPDENVDLYILMILLKIGRSG